MKRWLALFALVPLSGCIGMLRTRHEQQVTWDDGAPIGIEVWLNNCGPGFPPDWGWLLFGDVLLTPVLAIGEAVEGAKALVRDDQAVVGGVFGVLVSLLPGFTVLTMDPDGSRWSSRQEPLSLPAKERDEVAMMNPRQRVEWLVAHYVGLEARDEHQVARVEALRWWLEDVTLVRREVPQATDRHP